MIKITLKSSKKKLELKKTAITNLTLNEQQIGMIVGGGATVSRRPTKDPNNCTSNIVKNTL